LEWSQLKSELLGGFMQIVELPGAVFFFVSVQPLLNVEFSVFEQAIDQPGQFVGGGGDGRGGSKPGSHASVKSAQGRLAALERGGGHAQGVGHPVEHAPGMPA
jgi:hypothetical protein